MPRFFLGIKQKSATMVKKSISLKIDKTQPTPKKNGDPYLGLTKTKKKATAAQKNKKKQRSI